MSSAQNKSNAASNVASVANSEATSAASVKPVSVWKLPQTDPKGNVMNEAPENPKIEQLRVAQKLYDDYQAELAQKQKERDDKDSITLKGKLEQLAKIKADREEKISDQKEELISTCNKYWDIVIKKLPSLDKISYEEMSKKLGHLASVTQSNILDTMDYAYMLEIYSELSTEPPNWMEAVFQNSQNSISSNAPPLNKLAPSSSSSSSAPPPAERKSESAFKKVESKKKEKPSKCQFQSTVIHYRNKNGQLYHISKYDGEKKIHKCDTKGHGKCLDEDCPEIHYCPFTRKECGCHGAKKCIFEAKWKGNCTNNKCTFRHWDDNWIWAKQWIEADKRAKADKGKWS